MGQKVHPTGFRLGFNKTWRSRWYAEKEYANLLHEDVLLKRDLKKAGNKSRRQHLKRELTENPEEAPHSEYDFGRKSSETLNALDNDSTRKKKDEKADTDDGTE